MILDSWYKCPECKTVNLISPHDEDWHETGCDEAILEAECGKCKRPYSLNRQTTYIITKEGGK